MKKRFPALAVFAEDFRGKQRALIIGYLVLSFLFLGYIYMGKQAFLRHGGYGIPARLAGSEKREQLSADMQQLQQKMSAYRKNAEQKTEQKSGQAAEAQESPNRTETDQYKKWQKEYKELQEQRNKIPRDTRQEQIIRKNWRYAGWYLSGFFFLFALPVGFIALHPKLRLRDFGLGLGDWRLSLRVTAWFVGFMVAVVLALVLFEVKSFLKYYPMYAKSSSTYEGFALWFFVMEFFYLLYFIGWEFYFRSLLIFPLEKHLGSLAALVGVLPFAIMHVGKPPVEALGSIVAAYFLAVLVLKVRSYWICPLIHFLVAFSMDLAAALQKGLFR